MTDDELISILEDTDAGLAPTEGYGPAIEHVRALIGERDHLKGQHAAAVEQIQIDQIAIYVAMRELVERFDALVKGGDLPPERLVALAAFVRPIQDRLDEMGPT
jgi:hypothetical protein